jgi:hypothetical protein
MKIIKPDGTAIECTIEEYKEMQNFNTPKLRDEYITTYAKANSNRPKHYKKHRKSSCKKWYKWEDNVIKEGTEMKLIHKFLPDRSLKSIYSRRQKLKLEGKIPRANRLKRNYKSYTHNKKPINNNDGRVKMMRTVNALTQTLRSRDKVTPISELRSLAFKKYKESKNINTGNSWWTR